MFPVSMLATWLSCTFEIAKQAFFLSQDKQSIYLDLHLWAIPWSLHRSCSDSDPQTVFKPLREVLGPSLEQKESRVPRWARVGSHEHM